VLDSFGPYAGLFSVQMGSDQLSDDTVVNTVWFHMRRSCAWVTHAMVKTHDREDDVTFYNMPLEHAHSPHYIAILTV